MATELVERAWGDSWADAWADSWGIYSSADDGGASALYWLTQRRKRAKGTVKVEPQSHKLPPLAVLMEMLE